MLRTPRSLAIYLVLLFGVSSRLHAQASQSPSPIYYLLDHVSARTPKGLLGFEMGTQVELVKDLGNRVRVKRGDLEFDVDRRLLTNDLSIVSQAWENYRAQQEQLAAQAAAALAQRQQQAQEQQAEDEQRRALAIAAQQQQEAAARQQGAQWQVQQQPEIPSALQAVQAIQTEQTRQTELLQAEQQRQAEIAQAQALYRQRSLQQQQEEQRNANRAVLDDLERTMETRQLFHQRALSPLEENYVLSGARTAAANDYEAQQRLSRVEQQINDQRWEEHRNSKAWKDKWTLP